MSGRLYSFIQNYGSKMKYVYPESEIPAATYASFAYASYYILFNSLIPLAMLVTLEIGKMAYSRLIENDIEMTDYDQKGIREITESRVQNFTLHENLG